MQAKHGKFPMNNLDRTVHTEKYRGKDIEIQALGPSSPALPAGEEADFRPPVPTPEEEETGAQSALGELASASATNSDNYVPYTIKLPAGQLAALQSIWLELKRLYGPHSPDKSGMIQQAIALWLQKWDSPERQLLLSQLLDIREDTRRRQYRK